MFKKAIFTLLVFVITFGVMPQAKAQCSMCTINAEQGIKNGNTQGKGLNSGILYLLSIPYLLVAGVGIMWFLKYKKKQQNNQTIL